MAIGDGNSHGKFHFDGITPTFCGLLQVEVIFDINRTGILDVFARDEFACFLPRRGPFRLIPFSTALISLFENTV